MNRKIKYHLFISSNAIKGGPSSFTKNLANSFNYFKSIELTNNLLLSDIVLLIGENYKIKDLVLSLLSNKKIIYRLDGRRFSLLSSVKFKREGKNSIVKFFKAIFFEVKVITAFSLAKKIIYQSNFTRKQFNFIETIYKKNFKVVLNPININDLKNNPIDLNAKYEIPFDKYVVISKGYIHQSELLKVAYKLFTNLGIKIYVFGNYKNDILNKYPLIKFFGYVNSETYKSYLKNCFSFLCIEDYACCPNALIEAQFMGKPIIGPNNGSLPEMCPAPELQLLNYDSNIEIKLKKLIETYSENYDYWVKKSFKFADSKFGINQYKEYCKFFTNDDKNSPN